MVRAQDALDEGGEGIRMVEAYREVRGEAVHRLSLALAESSNAGRCPR